MKKHINMLSPRLKLKLASTDFLVWGLYLSGISFFILENIYLFYLFLLHKFDFAAAPWLNCQDESGE